MNFAVVGGGWAGIAAAVELTQRGGQVTLFEAGRVLGGRARSIVHHGRLLDNGQHILLGAYHETLSLIAAVGGDPARMLRRLPLQVRDNAGFALRLPKLPAPLHLAWGLCFARGPGLGEKLQTARWMNRVQAQQFRTDPALTVADWLDDAGQTGRFRQHLWEPLCLAALNTPAERASAQVFANVLRDSLGSPQRSATDLLLPRTNLSDVLPTPALAWLKSRGADIRLSHRVKTVNSADTQLEVDGEPFDGVILSVAPQHLRRLLPSTPEQLDYEPIATVYLQYQSISTPEFPLFNLIGKTGQWVVDRDNGLLACVLSGHGEWENLTDEALASTLHEELGYLVPPVWHGVIREKRATFSCRPDTQRPDWTTHHARLFVAGDMTWADYPGTLEGAVRSGLRAARACYAATSRPD